ncbi:MAG: outer membrane beta-barrel protein [Bacteroidota bacterium]
MRLLITCNFIALFSYAFAQTATCSRELDRAEEAFDQGRLLDVINNTRFMECFNDFSKEEKIRANKLLTKTYIFTDNTVEAERSLLKLLAVDPEHILARDDPSELHFLYSQFKTEPIFRVGLRIGVNKSIPVVLQEFNTFPGGQKLYNQSGSNTGLGTGLTIEALIERHIKNGIEVVVGPQLRTARYEVEGAFSGLQYLVKNQSQMLRIPLLGRYNWWYDRRDNENNRTKFIPYAFAGASFDFLLNAKYIDTNRTGGTTFTLPESNSSLSSLDQVVTTNVSLLIGAGFKYRVSKVHFLTFELRYDNALFNYINTDNRNANPVVISDIGHVEDDLTLNTISVTVGYTYSIYKPTKRKQYR